MTIEIPREARKEAIASIEHHEDAFQYWRKFDKSKKTR